MRMSTLLLRLAGPLQAWGYDSKFETRRTGREPTKSGVTGLLAAALGRRRDEPLDDLAFLKFGVRVDKEGELVRDYHTVKVEKKTPCLTYRYYLSDATFLVGFESEDETLLKTLEQALYNPAFPLFLGRRSCVPTLPLVIGVRPLGLIEALRSEPWQLSPWMQKKEIKKGHGLLRILTDAAPDEKNIVAVKDFPISFHPESRKYTYRPVKEQLPVMMDSLLPEETRHDVMAEL